MKMTDKEAMSPSTEDAIKYLEGMIFPQDFSPSTLRAVAVNKMAIAALLAQLERDNPKPLTLSIEAAADAIDLIERHGGCPPNKDCAEKQDCRKCYIEWLTSRLAPKEAQS